MLSCGFLYRSTQCLEYTLPPPSRTPTKVDWPTTVLAPASSLGTIQPVFSPQGALPFNPLLDLEERQRRFLPSSLLRLILNHHPVVLTSSPASVDENLILAPLEINSDAAPVTSKTPTLAQFLVMPRAFDTKASAEEIDQTNQGENKSSGTPQPLTSGAINNEEPATK